MTKLIIPAAIRVRGAEKWVYFSAYPAKSRELCRGCGNTDRDTLEPLTHYPELGRTLANLCEECSFCRKKIQEIAQALLAARRDRHIESMEYLLSRWPATMTTSRLNLAWKITHKELKKDAIHDAIREEKRSRTAKPDTNWITGDLSNLPSMIAMADSVKRSRRRIDREAMLETLADVVESILETKRTKRAARVRKK